MLIILILSLNFFSVFFRFCSTFFIFSFANASPFSNMIQYIAFPFIFITYVFAFNIASSTNMAIERTLLSYSFPHSRVSEILYIIMILRTSLDPRCNGRLSDDGPMQYAWAESHRGKSTIQSLSIWLRFIISDCSPFLSALARNDQKNGLLCRNTNAIYLEMAFRTFIMKPNMKSLVKQKIQRFITYWIEIKRIISYQQEEQDNEYTFKKEIEY